MQTKFKLNVDLDYESDDLVSNGSDFLEDGGDDNLKEDLKSAIYTRLADRLRHIADQLEDGCFAGGGDLAGWWESSTNLDKLYTNIDSALREIKSNIG